MKNSINEITRTSTMAEKAMSDTCGGMTEDKQ